MFGKAVALQLESHYDEATELYQRVLKRNPHSQESLANLIAIGMAKKDYEMVRSYSERLLEVHPQSTAALEGLAAWASDGGDFEMAAKFCTLLVDAVPNHFEGWFKPGSRPSEGRTQPAGRGFLSAGHQSAAASRPGLHQPGYRPPGARRAEGG